MEATRICSLPDCDRRHHARGFCRMHYLRHATPSPGKPRRPLRDRFMSFVLVDEGSGCWLWQGHIQKYGYGHFGARRSDGRWGPRRAHRVAYELFVGEIPEGMTLDHTCEVRHCVNPEHLQVASVRDNVLRSSGPSARNARAESCLRGHPLSGDNLQVIYSAAGVKRRCKECARVLRRARAAKRVES